MRALLRQRYRKRSIYGFKRATHIIDIHLRETIEGYIIHRGYIYKNIIVSNFYKLLFGLLIDASVPDAVSTGGTTLGILAYEDVNGAHAVLGIGQGVGAETFTDYTLTSGTDFSATITFSSGRVTLSGVAPVDGNEIGVLQRLNYFTAFGQYYAETFLLARKVMPIVAGQAITYNFIFSSPWVENLVKYVYGIISNTDVGLVNADKGARFTARTSGDVNADRTYIVLSNTAIGYSYSATSIPNPIILTPTTTSLFTIPVNYVCILGNYVPSADTTINTIALYQNLFDVGGAVHRTLLAILPLSSPITVKAGVNNLFVIRLVAV